ncbi:uncharacterized protein LOC128672367 isoform X2 [Plodia interpunctella]|nr:uncharacterized protein LOC128672367 isoform X2 [Plodia interpunctella]XP_053605448.1 uncharacterized protein LOC128672367 isoform X2 [Plodia interpunctella]
MSVSVQEDDDNCDVYTLYAMTDVAHHLTELSVAPCQEIPLFLMKVLSLCIPYNIYLNKLIMKCTLTSPAFYETIVLLTTSHITELYLDDSRLCEHNYDILLDYQTHLQLLSLARCSLTDDDCALLFSKLEYPNPASKNLNTLILSSNFISNIGAGHIANTLRSNRALMYLNLSGNRIRDAGAMEIFRTLMEFPITSEEIMQKRRRTIYHLKLRKEVYQKCYKQLMSTPVLDMSEDRSSKRRNTQPGILRRRQSMSMAGTDFMSASVAAVRAEKMTAELVAENIDPFSVESTIIRDNILYSKGNMVLSYLNLSYNYVGYESVVKLIEVMKYQALVGTYPELGLVGLQLDGNELPRCREVEALSALLAHALQVRLMYAVPQTGRRVDKSKKK